MVLNGNEERKKEGKKERKKERKNERKKDSRAFYILPHPGSRLA